MENCRVTLTFITEFESDDPETDLAELVEQAEFEPRDFIKTCYDRDYHTEQDIHPERDL
jgi:hypothetical protein